MAGKLPTGIKENIYEKKNFIPDRRSYWPFLANKSGLYGRQ